MASCVPEMYGFQRLLLKQLTLLARALQCLLQARGDMAAELNRNRRLGHKIGNPRELELQCRGICAERGRMKSIIAMDEDGTVLQKGRLEPPLRAADQFAPRCSDFEA